MKFHILFISMLLLGCFGIMDMPYMCKNAADADLRDRCFSTLALRDANAEMCKEVQDPTARDYCVMRIAISKLDELECSHIESSLKEKCEHVVQGLRQNNSWVCVLVKDNLTAELCRMRVS